VTVDDVLWRRSKLGLRVTEAEAKAISDFMDAQSSDEKLAAN
jgi:hypothetical protein